MSNRNSRKSGKNRREQTPKGRAYARSMQELRRSSATTPVPSGTDYRRKPKHVKEGWE
jgi:hypothetical protein